VQKAKKIVDEERNHNNVFIEKKSAIIKAK